MIINTNEDAVSRGLSRLVGMNPYPVIVREVNMSLNPTLNYLLEKFSVSVLPFSKQLANESTYLAGAGGLAGDGFPMPTGGVILGIITWDGMYTKDTSDTVEFKAGDRISAFAEHVGENFKIYVCVNGESIAIMVSDLRENIDLYACVYLTLQRT